MTRSPWRPGGWACVLCDVIGCGLAVFAVGYLLALFGLAGQP